MTVFKKKFVRQNYDKGVGVFLLGLAVILMFDTSGIEAVYNQVPAIRFIISGFVALAGGLTVTGNKPVIRFFAMAAFMPYLFAAVIASIRFNSPSTAWVIVGSFLLISGALYAEEEFIRGRSGHYR